MLRLQAEVGRQQQLCRPFAAGLVVPTPPQLPARMGGCSCGGRCPQSVPVSWCHSKCAAGDDRACRELGAPHRCSNPPPSPPALSLQHPVRQTEGVPGIAQNNLSFGEHVGLAVQSPTGVAAAGSWSEVLKLQPLHGSCDSLTYVRTSPAIMGFLSFARFIWSLLAFPVGAGLGKVRTGTAQTV